MLLLPCGYRPQRGRTGQRILPSNARPPHDLACQHRPPETPQNQPRRPPDDRWGTMQGTMPCRRNLVIGLLLLRLQVFWKWARQDSNPRPTDYESLDSASSSLQLAGVASRSTRFARVARFRVGKSWGIDGVVATRRRYCRRKHADGSRFGRSMTATRHPDTTKGRTTGARTGARRATQLGRAPPAEHSSPKRTLQIWLYSAT